MINRLYENDSHLKLFTAKVESCEKEKNMYKIVLDQTAFFPEGGGQKGDEGYILTGDRTESDFYCVTEEGTKVQQDVVLVLDTQEQNGIIYHYCSKELPLGEDVTGLLNYDIRFRRMQNHTGEHIVSGLIHKHFGFDNVGFHMGSDDVTLDINGVLTEEQLLFVEHIANTAVVSDVPVYAQVFSGEELLSLNYRSKLDLTENVRIVTVEGYDKCACCAPHVCKTGEIGIIKITGFINYKGGVRIHMLCGFDALDRYNKMVTLVSSSSALLSVKQDELYIAVERLMEENKKLKQDGNGLKNKISSLMLEKAKEDGRRCLFTDINDPIFMRYLATGGCEIFGLCGVFCALGGDNYRYVVVGKDLDMRQFAREMNSALCGRGGGDSELVQGSINAEKSKIEEFFKR